MDLKGFTGSLDYTIPKPRTIVEHYSNAGNAINKKVTADIHLIYPEKAKRIQTG
jgi:hypothetical protein